MPSELRIRPFVCFVVRSTKTSVWSWRLTPTPERGGVTTAFESPSLIAPVVAVEAGMPVPVRSHSAPSEGVRTKPGPQRSKKTFGAPAVAAAKAEAFEEPAARMLLIRALGSIPAWASIP